jgi:hypothetical protein
MILSENRCQPRIKSEGELFPDHARNAKSPDVPGGVYIEGKPIFVTTGPDPVVHAAGP